jgi:phage-related protein
MREVIFYRTASGKCPVEEFLDSLTAKQADKVTWTLSLVEDLRQVPRQNFKKLVGTDDIWEVRVELGSDIFRLLGFFDSGSLVVLTNGFVKKTQKTPPNEIIVAEERKRDYLNRKK